MDGPNGVGVLTSRSRHQRCAPAIKGGAAPRRVGAAAAAGGGRGGVRRGGRREKRYLYLLEGFFSLRLVEPGNRGIVTPRDS